MITFKTSCTPGEAPRSPSAQRFGRHVLICLASGAVLLSNAAHAQPKRNAAEANAWNFGAVIDLSHSDRNLALGARERNLQLGHSDLTAWGPVGSAFRAQATAVFSTHEGKLEHELEEAWIETTRLPFGITARGGRFSAQMGALNQQHTHSDDFSERPLLHRAMLGGHYNDDGFRLNLTLPTQQLYWMVGMEQFRGKRYVSDAVNRAPRLGVRTLSTRLGGDLGRSHSWQVGRADLRNKREAALEDEHSDHDHGDDGDEHEHEGEGKDHNAPHAADDHAHDHSHAALFTGSRMRLIDATWKWAPNGNSREQQLRVSWERARITGINRFAQAGDAHRAEALSVVWRFHPSWEIGARNDTLRALQPHDDHFHPARLDERSVMLAYKPTHQLNLRVQHSTQRGTGLEQAPSRALQLQLVMSFGAHGAHSF